MEDVLDAYRQLFIHSDEYSVSFENPFDSSEVDAVAKAMYEYILNPDDPAIREIVFRVPRRLEGPSIEYCEYASMFSEDMLYQNCSTKFATLDTEELRRALKTFLAGILYRYHFCVDQDRAAFPISFVLDYMDNVKILFSREQREHELPSALLVTLRALGSLDPVCRMKENVENFLKKRAQEKASRAENMPCQNEDADGQN
jgi:hypothetical protein